jgi:hypothetical protein
MEILKKLTGQECQDLTLFAVATPASPLAPQENDEELMTLDTCGHGLETPLATYDHATQFWKTSEDISLWGDYKSLESLPKSGITRNGVLYRQPEWVRPIDETELLLWPTPTTQENEHPGATWNSKGRRVAPSGVTHGMNLADAVQMWPTPTADDASNVNPKPNRFRGLVAAVNETTPIGGKLNPTWVEWLMGFPLGWTDLED